METRLEKNYSHGPISELWAEESKRQENKGEESIT